MTAGPIRPLTEPQRRVADLIGLGLDAQEVAHRLNLEVSTIRSHVQAIALLLPNPDEIPPYRLVMLWAAHQRWIREHYQSPKSA